MAWRKNGSNTLLQNSDDLDLTLINALKFNVLLMHCLEAPSSTYTPDMTLDNTGGDDYSRRGSTNGGADVTVTSQAFVENGLGGIGTTSWTFTLDYIVNITSQEKIGIGLCIAGLNGVTNAPSRLEFTWKKDTTTNNVQFTRIDINNADAGDIPTGSNISALGTD